MCSFNRPRALHVVKCIKIRGLSISASITQIIRPLLTNPIKGSGRFDILLVAYSLTNFLAKNQQIISKNKPLGPFIKSGRIICVIDDDCRK